MDASERDLLGAQLRARALQWRAFNRWKQLNRPPERPAAEILADLDWLRSLAVADGPPPPDRDPRKSGVARMKRILSLLGGRP